MRQRDTIKNILKYRRIENDDICEYSRALCPPKPCWGVLGLGPIKLMISPSVILARLRDREGESRAQPN